MAKLSNFRVDSKKIDSGEWVKLEEYDDLELLVRGYTDAYTDYRAAKLRRAAVNYGGNIDKIPTQKTREIMLDAIIQHVLLDVRNLLDEKGEPVALPRFIDLLRDGDYSDLVLAVLKAAALVGTRRQEDIETAKKN